MTMTSASSKTTIITFTASNYWSWV